MSGPSAYFRDAEPHQRPPNAQEKTLRIGCFGSVLAFSPQSETCKTCNVRQVCGKVVVNAEAEALERLERAETGRFAASRNRETVEVEAIDESKYAAVKAFFTRRRTALQPEKKRVVRDRANMAEKGVDFSAIKRRENPFKDFTADYDWMRFAVDYLLTVEGGVKQSDIAEYYHELGLPWTPGSRATLAGRAIRVLHEAGVLKKERSVYCLS